MTNGALAVSYLAKAEMRLGTLPVLFEQAGYSDVVREAQEIVELALKGMLRQAGVETPRWHDVGGVLREHAGRFPAVAAEQIERLAEISAWLRQNRELSFYGDDGFIPTERYTRDHAQRAMDGARLAAAVAATVIGRR